MPALAAEESLTRVAEHAIGAGVMPQDQQRRVLAEWRKLAAQKQGKARRLKPDQLGVVLAGMGIGMQRVGKRDGHTG
jgi:hypothetical protein